MATEDKLPRQILVDMAQGFVQGKALCAAVRLGIADALGDNIKHVDELAVDTKSMRDPLYRLLRALAGIGILKEISPGSFSLTSLGQPLRRDAVDSVWSSMIFWPDLLADSWTYLAECVQDGGGGGAMAVMERDGVKSRWSRESDPQAIFHGVFAEPGATDMAAFANAYDFSKSRIIADLGGAGGGLMSAILALNPDARGILFDQEEAINRARTRFAADELTDRCTLVVGNLLESVPEGADVYIMKSVLHGFNSDDAQRILSNCRSVMKEHSRLLLIEIVLPEMIDQTDPKLERLLLADINMLVVTGGQERNTTQWESLLSSSGFDQSLVMPISGEDASIIEAVVHPEN